jgi:hypothetical protein
VPIYPRSNRTRNIGKQETLDARVSNEIFHCTCLSIVTFSALPALPHSARSDIRLSIPISHL